MVKKTLLATALLFVIYFMPASGQVIPDSAKLFRIETQDGNIYTGSIVSEDQFVLVLKTSNLGELKIQQTDIKSKTELRQVTVIDGQFWLPNPQSSRYFWAPNGYGLEKGDSYYQNIWVLYNQVSFGVADNFSIGAGMLPLFLFAGTSSPFWIVPKISIPLSKDKLNIGTGAFLGTIVGEGSGVFGLLYETTTFGSRDRNVSIGFAYGFAQDAWMERPIINFSSMVRTGPRGYFISENYLIPYESYSGFFDGSYKNKYAIVLSLGGRSIIRNIGLDYSLWIPLNAEMDNFVAIPFLGVTIPMSKKGTGRSVK